MSFEKKPYDERFPAIGRSWQNHWDHITPFFDYPQEIRTVIYTTNAIESLNSSFRKISRSRHLFPSVESLYKLFYLAIENISKKWKMPIPNWSAALNRFSIEFEDRMPNQYKMTLHKNFLHRLEGAIKKAIFAKKLVRYFGLSQKRLKVHARAAQQRKRQRKALKTPGVAMFGRGSCKPLNGRNIKRNEKSSDILDPLRYMAKRLVQGCNEADHEKKEQERGYCRRC